MNIFKTVEDAIVTRLSGIQVRTLEVYSGQLTSKEVSKLTYNFPCIYIAVQGMDCTVVNRSDRGTLRIAIISGDQNLRGAKTAVDGDLNSVGVYAIMQAVYENLQHWQPCSECTPFKIKKITAYEPAEDIFIFSQEFEGEVMYVIS